MINLQYMFPEGGVRLRSNDDISVSDAFKLLEHCKENGIYDLDGQHYQYNGHSLIVRGSDYPLILRIELYNL